MSLAFSRLWTGFALALAIGLTAPGLSHAQSPARPIDIAAKSPADALVDLALQTGTTIGGAVRCLGPQVRLRGAFTLAEALDRILANSDCAYRIVDARTVRILAAPRRAAEAKPAPKPKPLPPASPAAESVVRDLLISAQRRPQFAGEPAGGVSIIRATRIGDQGLIDTDSVARQSAGFTTTNLGPARNKILLRGLSDGVFTGRTQSTVGTYLDDIPVTYNAPDPDLRLADVEALEILRGPQGALYGGGSLTGVYRIVSRKPELDISSGYISATGSETKGGAPSASLEGMGNVVLAKGRLALRTVVYSDRDGGYLENDNLRLSNVDLTQRRGGRVALLWRINDQWDITASGAAQDLNSADTQYVAASRSRSRANQVRETHSNHFAEGALALAGQGDWGQLRSTLAYVRHDYASRYDATFALTAFEDAPDEIGIFDERTANRTLVGDVYWSSPPGGRWRLMTGLFGSGAIENLPSQLQSRAGATLRSLYNEQRRDSRSEGALYGEAAYDMGGGWTAVAGVRAFTSHVHTRSQVDVPTRPARLLDQSTSFDGFAPKVSIQKTWSDNLSIYALASSGYRAGGFNSGGLLAPPPQRAAFRPDQLQNFELGWHYRTAGHRFRFDGAVFHDYWRRLQTDQYLVTGFAYTANVGNGASRGVEGELSYQWREHWLLQGNFMFDDAKVVSLDPAFSGVVGARLPGVPRTAMNALVTYQTPVRKGLAIVATGQAAYTGGSGLTFDPRFSPYTGGYYTANLTLQLVGDQASLAVLISNPFDTSKDTFAYGNPFSFGQIRQATPQRPRTIGVRLKRSF